jgi:excisionase family DNA binding protein
MPKPPTDWIDLGEAVDIFAAAGVHVSRSTLARWARDGKLQYIKPGRSIYVRRAQVRAMLRPRRRPGVSASEVQPALFEDLDE